MPYLVMVLFALVACQAAPMPADTASAPGTAPTSAAAPQVPAEAPSPISTVAALPPAPARTANPLASCAPTTSKATVTLAGRTIPVDVAWTPETRATGLSGRPCLAKDTGLVLGWDQPNLTRIWMPDMNFAIDVIFVRDAQVVAIFADAQPCVRGEPCPTFGPASAVDYVLEVPAGSAKTWGLEKGAPITLKR